MTEIPKIPEVVIKIDGEITQERLDQLKRDFLEAIKRGDPPKVLPGNPVAEAVEAERRHWRTRLDAVATEWERWPSAQMDTGYAGPAPPARTQRRRGRERAMMGPPPTEPCGTMAAARRHYRRHEPLDESCRQAVRRAKAAYTPDPGAAGTNSPDKRETRNNLPEFTPYRRGAARQRRVSWTKEAALNGR